MPLWSSKPKARKIYGNPFESNVLVRVMDGRTVVQSFFIHELPPNCPVDHLRERIAERKLPFRSWDMTFQGKVIEDGKSFSDYGILSWDHIQVHEKQQRFVDAVRQSLSLPRPLRFCYPNKRASLSAPQPLPYGYLPCRRSNTSIHSLFVRESLDGETKPRYIL